jgi:hypothetical protein
MAITVKRLISALEEIENKYLEVEFLDLRFKILEIDYVKKVDKKVLIFAKNIKIK